MFERSTERARRVLFFARYEASELGSLSIDTEHVLLPDSWSRAGRWTWRWWSSGAEWASPQPNRRPREPDREQRKHDRPDVRPAASHPQVTQEARDDQKPHRVEDEECAHQRAAHSKNATHPFIPSALFTLSKNYLQRVSGV